MVTIPGFLILGISVMLGVMFIRSFLDPYYNLYHVDGSLRTASGDVSYRYNVSGVLDATTRKLVVCLPFLQRSGPVTEAFIAEQTPAGYNKASVLSFPGPRPFRLVAQLSRKQMRRLQEGNRLAPEGNIPVGKDGYVLVVRTASTELIDAQELLAPLDTSSSLNNDTVTYTKDLTRALLDQCQG